MNSTGEIVAVDIASFVGCLPSHKEVLDGG
jgi:hypothetical protein